MFDRSDPDRRGWHVGFDPNALGTANLAESALDLSYEARARRHSAACEAAHRSRAARRDQIGTAVLVATAATALADTVIRIIDLVRG
jgi:hypothetical protein